MEFIKWLDANAAAGGAAADSSGGPSIASLLSDVLGGEMASMADDPSASGHDHGTESGGSTLVEAPSSSVAPDAAVCKPKAAKRRGRRTNAEIAEAERQRLHAEMSGLIEEQAPPVAKASRTDIARAAGLAGQAKRRKEITIAGGTKMLQRGMLLNN